MKSIRIVLATLVTLALPALAQESATSNMEILRDKIKADKKALVAEAMELSDAEGKTFWPVYDAYQKDLQKINERLKTTIKAYADAYNKGPIPNETAKKLIHDAVAIDESEVALKRSYLPKLEKVLPYGKVARYIQIDNKIRALLKYELASEIPLAE